MWKNRFYANISKSAKKYHLRYFVAFGTLLGTVRHKGFIPWDDDIDVGMPREDYENSFRLHKKNAGKSIFFRLWIRIRSIICIFAKLRMNRTRFVENSLQSQEALPDSKLISFLDEISDDGAEMEKQLNRSGALGGHDPEYL